MNNAGSNMHTVCTVLCMTTVCHGVVACVHARQQMMIHVTHRNIHKPGVICLDVTCHTLCGIDQHPAALTSSTAVALRMPLCCAADVVVQQDWCCGTPTLSAHRTPRAAPEAHNYAAHGSHGAMHRAHRERRVTCHTLCALSSTQGYAQGSHRAMHVVVACNRTVQKGKGRSHKPEAGTVQQHSWDTRW